MAWDGYNFEDAIIISEKLVKDDTYTSIHIEEFEIEIRETKLGKEEFTRDIPNVSPKALAQSRRIRHRPRSARSCRPGDILVGKVSPKSNSELTPEEKLLHAIFGRAGEDVKNDSLEVPSGVEGIVIDTQRFSRRAQHVGRREARRSTRSRRTSKPLRQGDRRPVPGVAQRAGTVAGQEGTQGSGQRQAAAAGQGRQGRWPSRRDVGLQARQRSTCAVRSKQQAGRRRSTTSTANGCRCPASTRSEPQARTR